MTKKTLIKQSWKIESDNKDLFIDFKLGSDSEAYVEIKTGGKLALYLTKNEFKQVKNIFESTKFIFKQ